MSEAQPNSSQAPLDRRPKVAALLLSFLMVVAAVAIVALVVPWTKSPPPPRDAATVIDVPEGSGPPPRTRPTGSKDDMSSLDRSSQ